MDTRQSGKLRAMKDEETDGLGRSRGRWQDAHGSDV